MEWRSFDLDGPLEIIPRKIGDERGYFSETFRMAEFADRTGIDKFVQDNQSLSTRVGTVRGIHFQSKPSAQGKLVRCLAGSLFDVAVDLRGGSPTFGQWLAVTLTPDQNNQLWVPVGFGHGFCTLEPDTVIAYRVTDYYDAEQDRGVAWDDPGIAIDWPSIADPETLSAKDRAQPALAEVGHFFTMDDK